MKVLVLSLVAFMLTTVVTAQTASTGGSGTATPAAVVKVTGEVTKPLTLSAADLAAMPRTTAIAKDKQGAEHSFSGVALRDIFKEAGVTTGRQLRGENLAKYVLVTCADNYRVVFSLAELDSSFTDRVVILADQMDGKPLPAGVGPFRIIVPGEKKPARNCFRVTGIAIKFAKD
jgi:DMSO/TMAO reductase YedYZ molybdopterin-dependent catalytic subunit